MANWLTNGGCFNAMRWANDGAGQGARDWAAAIDADLAEHPFDVELILATSWDSDDMDATTGDFELQFRNLTDAGSWTVMGAATEIKEGTATDLINGNAVVAAEDLGQDNCSGMGVTRVDGVEREGANSIALVSVASDSFINLHWAVNFADGTLSKEYEFRVVETGTSNVYATLAGTVFIVPTFTVAGVTRDHDEAALISVDYFIYVRTGLAPETWNNTPAKTGTSSGTDGTWSEEIPKKTCRIIFVKEGDPPIQWATRPLIIFDATTDDFLHLGPQHGLANDDQMRVHQAGTPALPTGLSEGTTYFVVSLSGDDCKLSLTQGGAAVDLTAVGEGIIVQKPATT